MSAAVAAVLATIPAVRHTRRSTERGITWLPAGIRDLFRSVDACFTRSPGLLPLTRRKRFADGQNFDAKDAALRVDVVDEGSSFFRMIDRAATDRQIDGISFRIVGQIDHGFRL